MQLKSYHYYYFLHLDYTYWDFIVPHYQQMHLPNDILIPINYHEIIKAGKFRIHHAVTHLEY